MTKVITQEIEKNNIKKSIENIFKLSGGIEKYIFPGNKVLLKPNFIAPKNASTGTTTDLRIIEAVIQILIENKAIPIVGEGVPFAYDANIVFRELGMTNLAKKYNIQLVDLDKYKIKEYQIKNATTLKHAKISELVFEVDKIINLPKMKTHMLTTVTLGMKNLKGCLAGKEKLVPHHIGVSESIPDLNTLIKPTFTILDGIVSMENQGPTNGTPLRTNIIMGSDDILALEIIATKTMGIDPYSVKHIILSKNRNIGEYNINNIETLGAKKQFHFKFKTSKYRQIKAKILFSWVSPALLKIGIDVRKYYNKLANRKMPYPIMLGRCTGCSKCIINCPQKAISYKGKKNPIIDKKKCIKCYVCDEVCIYKNIEIKN